MRMIYIDIESDLFLAAWGNNMLVLVFLDVATTPKAANCLVRFLFAGVVKLTS